MVQDAVKKLCAVSKELTDSLNTEQLATAAEQIDALIHPLSPDDIRALLGLLPQAGDTAAGLNWSILHAIEASPNWPMWDLLSEQGNEWVRIFWLRLANRSLHPPA